MAKTAQHQFNLPATEDAARGRLQVLHRTINEAAPLVAQLDALLKAKDAFKAAQAEADYINANLPAIRQAGYALVVRSIRVIAVRPVNAEDESPIAAHTVSYERNGQAYAEALHTADRAVQQAVIESGKLPGRISKLAATPAEAFARWADGRRRGYLRG